MKVTRRSRRWMRFQNHIFLLLLLVVVGLLAWLSTRYNYQADWTANARNTLSSASTALLERFRGEIKITAYVTEDKLLRKRIAELVGRYQRYYQDIELVFVNPDLEPQRVRDQGITMNGELVIEYGGFSEKLRDPSERGLSNALQRVARGGERRITFLAGHGERAYQGRSGFDISNWAVQLENKGYSLGSLNLIEQPDIPDNISMLVIADPRVDLLVGEVEMIRRYVDGGGNLLWLQDPAAVGGELHGLAPLAESLNIHFQQGIVVDPNVSQLGELLFGSNDPRIALVPSYDSHPITENFNLNTLFPVAGGIDIMEDSTWSSAAFLKTLSNTWLETDEVVGTVSFDIGKDTTGPITLGVALSRPLDKLHGDDIPTSDVLLPDETQQKNGEQRAVVIADGDFLSNAFLGASGNLQLAMNITNWLSSDDELITVPARIAPDTSLELSDTAIAVIGFGFLVVLPLGLLGSGLLIWFRRRRR